jgi:hypothetical protein
MSKGSSLCLWSKERCFHGFGSDEAFPALLSFCCHFITQTRCCTVRVRSLERAPTSDGDDEAVSFVSKICFHGFGSDEAFPALLSFCCHFITQTRCCTVRVISLERAPTSDGDDEAVSFVSKIYHCKRPDDEAVSFVSKIYHCKRPKISEVSFHYSMMLLMATMVRRWILKRANENGR